MPTQPYYPQAQRQRDAQTRAAGRAIDFGELRSMLQRPPSEELWRVLTSVLRMMELGDPTTFEEQIAPYVERALERWPDALRVMTQHWHELAQAGKLPPRCAGLVRVMAAQSHHDSDALIKRILRTEGMDHITHMELSYLREPALLAELLCSPRAAKLTHLTIGPIGWYHSEQEPVLTSGLVGQPLIARPTHLSIQHARLTDEALTELATLPLIERVERLDLTCSGPFTATGLRALLCSPHLKRLRSLSLRDCKLDADAARAIQDMPTEGASLEHLDLQGNPIGPDGARALADTPALAALTSLHLAYTGLGEGAATLFESGHLTRLTHLDLTNTGATNATVAALVAAPIARTLTSLDLSGCGLSDGAAQLLGAAPFEALHTLRLMSNHLGDDTRLGALLAGGDMPALHTLDLRRNNIRQRAARELFLAAHAPALRVLELGENNVGDDGVRSLAASALLGQLEHLALEMNAISLRGAVSLLESPHIHTLKRLQLTHNPIPAAHRLAGFIEGLELIV